MAVTVETLSHAFCVAQNASDMTQGQAKWRWAKQLDTFLVGIADKRTRTTVSAQIGVKIGEELKRAKPYSGSFVRQHAAAYRKYPTEPKTPEEFRAFLAAVNGNAGPSKQPKEETDGNGTGTPNNGAPKSYKPEDAFLRAVLKARKDGLSNENMIAIITTM